MTEPIPPIEQQPPTGDKGFESSPSQIRLPRITIQYCTQCKWMLRAAYFGQELLQTFGTAIGEVSLMPTTGGIFTVTMLHSSRTNSLETETKLLWDRKTHGGFPEVKQLKSMVRDVIDPLRDLGHVDRALSRVVKGDDSASTPPVDAKSDDSGSNVPQSDPKISLTTGDSGQSACHDCQ
ncbi:Rdx family-domain-containing protein [Talaromyces proteolyticus]|uniref:Rdx family-domain-containing protein n=1 Tax=Talaromyces proteolyticus TaxID=1131652 RepID=A0AAD4PY03_9EURO|nr:Rdx family-domain-containing protein [Talaromyces proteolyticus]KAH8700610.1 Rdx family-domain-containing protein [Talaromyces proteolyticus]